MDRPARWALGLGIPLICSACNSLWGIDELSYGVGGGQTASSGVSSASGNGGSAGGGGEAAGGQGGGTSFCNLQSKLLFCEDFESPAFADEWTAVTGGADIDSLASAGSYSLLATMPQGNNNCAYAGAYQDLALSSGGDWVVSFDMRPTPQVGGSFYAIPFRITVGTCEVLLYHSGTNADIRFNGSQQALSMAPPLGQWSRLRFEMLSWSTTPMLHVFLDGMSVTPIFQIPPACKFGSQPVEIAPQIHCYGEMAAVEIRYDNVLVERL